MSYAQNISIEWQKANKIVAQSEAFQKLLNCEISLDHYKSALRQIYSLVRENPKIHALSAVHLREDQRTMLKPVLKHAISDVGLDSLVRCDLEAMGEDISSIVNKCPLPATIALFSYGYYQVQYRNPAGYLGYLFHLEFSPLQSMSYIQALGKIGIPENAMRYFLSHAVFDWDHYSIMEQYVEALVKTNADMEAVNYSIHVTASLYSNMLRDAFSVADDKNKHSGNEARKASSGIEINKLNNSSIE